MMLKATNMAQFSDFRGMENVSKMIIFVVREHESRVSLALKVFLPVYSTWNLFNLPVYFPFF